MAYTTTSYVSASLTANGGSNGLVQVADTSQFVVNAYVWLKSSASGPTQYQVAVISDATHMYVKDPSNSNFFGYANVSAFTTAQSATITQPAQQVFNPKTDGHTDVSAAIGILAIANGGTGSATQNFVDLTSPQSVGGAKTFTTAPVMSGASITAGTIAAGALAAGAAASNLGSAGGDLSGTYPSPTVAAGAISAGKLASGAAASNLGSAGGDLTGTYPSPTIAAGAVTATKLASGAAVTNIGFTPAASGANSDITALSGITGDVTLGGTGKLYGYLGNINAQTGTTYTLQASDTGKIITCSNASAITVTLPNSLPAGFNCTIVQKGAGQVTFSPAAGATMNNRSSQTKTAGQWGMCSLYIDTNAGGASAIYVLGGDTGP